MKNLKRSLLALAMLCVAGVSFAGVGNVTSHRWRSDGVQTISDFPVSINGGLGVAGSVSLSGPTVNISQIAEPTGAPTAALASPPTPGSVDNGDMTYAVAFASSITGVTGIGPVSNTVTVVDNSVNGQILLTNIPQPTHPSMDQILIFRDQDGGGFNLLATLNKGTTAYADNTDTASISGNPPSANNTGSFSVGGFSDFLGDVVLEQSNLFLFSGSSNNAQIDGPNNVSLFPFLDLRPVEAASQTHGLWVVPDGNDFTGNLILLNHRHSGGSAPFARFDEYARLVIDNANANAVTPDAAITVNGLAPGTTYGLRVAAGAGKTALGNWIEFTGNGSASPSGVTYGFGVDNTGEMFAHFGNGSGFAIRSSGTDVAEFRQQRVLNLIQAAATGGVAKGIIRATGAAITNSTASTEYNDVYINANRAVQFASGLLPNQRFFLIDAGSTISFTGASTASDADAFASITMPQQGTNATVGRASAGKFGSQGYTGTSSNNFGLTIIQPGIANGTGGVSTQAGLFVWSPTTVHLGNQTANVTGLFGGYFASVAYDSTTNTRTVPKGATLYVEGAQTDAGNVTFTNTGGPFAFFVDSGDSRFDGAILGSSASITAANDLLLGSGTLQIVSGNTTINGLSTTLSTGPAITAGTHMTLVFTGTPTVKHNTAPSAGYAKLFLAGSVDITAANNFVLKVVYDGTQWQEVSRKAP